VACLAAIAASPVVCVILRVAAKTCGWRVFKRLDLMTVSADGLPVLAYQWVVSRVMIEIDFEPVGFVVAVRTFRAEIAVVNVVVAMT
jgi:hypothetical protein